MDLAETVLAEARLAWPQASWRLDDVERRLAGVDPAVWAGPSGAGRRAEVLLAWACLLGDEDALRRAEVRYVADVVPNLAALGLSGAELDEVLQNLRVALFVGSPGGDPRLARYAGRGELGGFIRTVAVRLAIDLKRGHRAVAPADLARLVIAPMSDPELDYQKELYTGRFAEALEAAWSRLSSAERLILRYHLLDGLGIDQLAAIYRVHRSTAARRCASARERLVTTTRAELGRRVGAGDRTVESILRLITSRLDVELGASGEPA
jgi:RNA polymerase sigma-70 factor (ECF subfamily)